MIEDSKTVKTITVKVGGKSGTYWTVAWTDGKTDTIFNGDWLPLLERSQKENCPLHFTKEKAEGSKYYNIKSLELAPEKEQTNEKIYPQRQGKSLEEQKSIECQVAVMEVGRAYCAGKITDKDPLVLGWRLWCAERLSVTEAKPLPVALESTRKPTKQETDTTGLKEVKNAQENKGTTEIKADEKITPEKILADLKILLDSNIRNIDWMLKELKGLGFEDKSNKVAIILRLMPQDKLEEFYTIIQEAKK